MDEGNTLRLRLGDWQWNAAIIGFINIVGKENVIFIKDTIEFAPELLKGFEEKYFNYLIHSYERTLSWYKIVSYKDKLDGYINTEFSSISLKELEGLNNYIRDMKRFIKSNSYKAAYELIFSEVDMLSLEKRLNPLKVPKNQQQYEVDKNKIIDNVKAVVQVLMEIINYCNSWEGKRYIAAKNVIYTLINNAWNGVAFLNKQPQEKNVYMDYKRYFINGAVEYLTADKTNYKYNCFVCDEPIKDLSHDLSFLNATGFDVARKSSHVWNFQNDIAICPLCKLVFSCLPAGIAYVYDRGIYVNENQNVENAFNINYLIKTDILKNQEGSNRSIYPALVAALQKKENDTTKYELADIQVVRYENGSYRFNILSRKMLEIVVESKDDLDKLIKAVLIENNVTLRIYNEVITRLFNNQNLITLIHRLMYNKLSNPDKCYYNSTHLISLLKINRQIYTRLGGLKLNKTEGNDQANAVVIWAAKTAGEELKKRYQGKAAQHKLPGICYRLLNALKTSNKEMFMDVTLNCYLYVRMQVPRVITSALSNDKEFGTMGYAFVAALIDDYTTGKENLAPVANEEVMV